MSMDNSYMTKRIENVTLKSGVRRGTTFTDSLKKRAWFAGLYIASLFCLSATGASVRWILAYL